MVSSAPRTNCSRYRVVLPACVAWIFCRILPNPPNVTSSGVLLPAVCCCQPCVVASCVLLPAVHGVVASGVLLPAVRCCQLCVFASCTRCCCQLCVYCERQGSNLGVGILAAGDSGVVTGRSPPPHRHHCAPTQRRQRLQDLAVNSNP